MAQFKDFNAYRKEQAPVEPLNFKFGYQTDEGGNYIVGADGEYVPREYSVTPKLSFVLTRMIVDLEKDLQEFDLNNSLDQIKVLDRAGEIISQLVGPANWKQLQLDGFDVPAALAFLEWIGNEAATAEEPDGDEEEPEAAIAEPDPDEAPGAGDGGSEGKGSQSQRRTFSATGAQSSTTSSGSAEYPPVPFSG